ncbi:PAS domain-containing protein [Pedobacter sp. L105]|uniref:PAS domain-containing protein n=1 Tax=Pedobacter sp. L105 TaxID=1641871 RepID=UPI00131BF45C|nr:PAS domain-containing protein [Pedobacter sp. L105]
MSRSSFIENEPLRFAEITNSDYLYQKAPCGFISFLPDGSILRVNETFSRWIGLTEEEIYNLKFTSLLAIGGNLYYEMVITPLLSIRGFASEINFSFIGPNGNFDALFNAVAYKDEEGMVIAVNATVQNITDRKKYEAELLQSKRYAEEEKRRFEFLSNTIPNLIWTALPTGELNFINQKLKDYFSEGTVIDYRKFNGVFHEDREAVVVSWRECLESGRKLEKEIRLHAKGKDPEWFLLRAEPYYDEDRKLVLWFGSFTNIHKQKLLQLANYSSLSSSLSLAHKTIDDNKEMFMKIAMNQSHMIRKPVANIIGLISLLNEVKLSEEGKELIELLNKSADELDMLIKEIVSHTRVSV